MIEIDIKKRILLVSLCVFLFSGCGKNVDISDLQEEKKASELGRTIEITEKMFITQINDIYINSEDYLDKELKLQGIYENHTEDGQLYHFILRNGPGCCGNDDVAGFEFVWSGEYPNQNDWIEVVGIPEVIKEDKSEYLRLNLTSLTVLEERGAEYVTH